MRAKSQKKKNKRIPKKLQMRSRKALKKIERMRRLECAERFTGAYYSNLPLRGR